MKKIFSKKGLIYVILALAVVLILLGVILFGKFSSNKEKTPSNKENVSSYKDRYIYDNDIYRDATVISNGNLDKEHCLDDVCIQNLKIYQGSSYYNVELQIVNKTGEAKTNQLALVFGDRVLFVSYKDLKGGNTTNYTIELGDKTISDTSDFTVRYLTDEEKGKFHVK